MMRGLVMSQNKMGIGLGIGLEMGPWGIVYIMMGGYGYMGSFPRRCG